MNSLARTGGLLAAVLVLAAASGCYSPPPRSVRRVEPARDFEIVETSVRRPLTEREMADLRRLVRDYLDKQQSTDSGDYYVKVYFNPTEPGAAEEWVVVRFTRYAGMQYVARETYGTETLVGPYYSWDVYPYGYGSFGRISFQYYDDPFYGQRYYYPPRGHDRDRHHDPKPGGDKGGPGGQVGADGPNRNPDVTRRPREPRTERPSGVVPAADVDRWNRRSSPSNPGNGNRDWQNRGPSDTPTSTPPRYVPPSGSPSTPAPRYDPPPPPQPAPPPRYDPPPPPNYAPVPEHRAPPPSGDSRPANDGHRQPDER